MDALAAASEYNSHLGSTGETRAGREQAGRLGEKGFSGDCGYKLASSNCWPTNVVLSLSKLVIVVVVVVLVAKPTEGTTWPPELVVVAAAVK